MGELSLAAFDPLVAGWFEEAFGMPTPVQAAAWPVIAGGEHALITAPTGSGKTLTAFLWALDRLLTGAWEAGRVRVLYVSPLRALNTDIRRNLLAPLEALSERFVAAGRWVPGITAMTRSGDTPPSERQRMLRRPPEILITTPESLNILLTSKRGRGLLGGIRTVILDEIHAVAAGKRGTHLITAVDRLVPLVGEFQRIALSATVEPLADVAAFVGGLVLTEIAGAERFTPRPVRIVEAPRSKRYAIEVHCPWHDDASASLDVPAADSASPAAEVQASEALAGGGGGGGGGAADGDNALWQRLAAAVRARVAANRSTLIFANSRRATEKLTHIVNDGALRPIAYAHHGSLSREVRTEVERRLKRGDLEAIVSTSSLELGIDIGSLDEVLMAQTPPSVASATQRIGRAGHGVGEVSSGRFYPIHPRDVLDAAVVARSVLEQAIEAVRPVEMPLDILAQIILSMVATESWTVVDLFALLRTSWPYRHLKRRQLELVLDMLAGRYADCRIRELRPRLTVDPLDGSIRARPGVARLVYQSGGTIPDRGYFALRMADSGATLGELDEEFVWERSVGDSFTLGTQVWQIRAITHNDVLVMPRGGGGAMAPFWRADALDRPFVLAERIASFLAGAEARLADKGFAALLSEEYCLDAQAASALIAFLRDQKAVTGCLPHRRRLLVERLTGARGDGNGEPLLLHTLWGGKVNRPFAMVLEAAWEERFGSRLETHVDDSGVLLRPTHSVDKETVLGLVTPERVEELLRRRLEGTGFFGAQFRIAAQAALLLPRAGFRHRTPLWLSRQRAKKLLATVTPLGDFPIVIETWRACLRDAFDLEALRQVLAELADGEIEVVEALTAVPSPFAAGLAWTQTNQLMYEDDTPESGQTSKLQPDLLQEVVFASHLRPRLPGELVAEFERKLSRTWPGYTPAPGADLADWLGERLLLTAAESDRLVDAVVRDHQLEHPGLDRDLVFASVADRALWLALGNGAPALVTPEAASRLGRALGIDVKDLSWTPLEIADDKSVARLESRLAAASDRSRVGDPGEDVAVPMASVVAEWLRYHGPVAETELAAVFGLGSKHLARVLESLEASRTVVVDLIVEAARQRQVVDAENLERLLRWLRRARRLAAETRPVGELAPFLAAHQGLAEPGNGIEDLERRLEQLVAFPARAELWETAILPSRFDPYYPAWLDTIMQQSELMWLGVGTAKLAFAYAGDRDLMAGNAVDGDQPGDGNPVGEIDALLPDGYGRYPIESLAQASGLDRSTVARRLWAAAWRGEVTNDGFLAVRQAAARRFQEGPEPAAAPPTSRAGFRRVVRRRGQQPFPGTWRRLPTAVPPADALDRELMDKERARIVLERFGIVFRQLLARETPAFTWSRLFRALRLMELSGEVLAGRFFDGIDGPQFLSLSAFKILGRGLPTDALYWLNAADPASLAGVAGLGLDGLPARRTSSWLAYHGSQLVLVAKRSGDVLDIRVPPDHPRLGDYLALLGRLLTRTVSPRGSLRVETISGLPAAESEHAPALGRLFRMTREGSTLRLWKRFRPELAPTAVE